MINGVYNIVLKSNVVLHFIDPGIMWLTTSLKLIIE